MKKNYEALRQREEEERMMQSSPSRGGEDSQSVSKWEKESHEATRELLKVKDRLIEVERNVSMGERKTSCLYAPYSLTWFIHLWFVPHPPASRMPHFRLRRLHSGVSSNNWKRRAPTCRLRSWHCRDRPRRYRRTTPRCRRRTPSCR